MPPRHAGSIRSRRVVLPDGERPATIRFADGLIVSIDPHDANAPADADDLGDLVVLPGLIDPHVHVNEPGRTEWEGFATATRAAAAGGITLIADMPLNSSPVTTTLDALHYKLDAASGQLTIDAAFHGGLVPGNLRHLPALVEAGVTGIKAFMCHSGLDEFPASSEVDLLAAMRLLADLGVPLLAHAEITHDTPPPPVANPASHADYVASRPRSFERDAIELLIKLCRQTGAAVHVVHLADADSLDVLTAARAEGLPITIETCPHYLTIDPAAIPDGATEFKCAPPIRGDGDRLLAALRDGRIDLIASDHSPCPPAMKATGRFDTAWGGIASLQFGLSLVRSLPDIAPSDIAYWMSAAPAALLGVERTRGSIAVGKRADLAVVDWDAEWTVDPAKLEHRHAISPYAGRTLGGVVRRTYLGGVCVYRDGEFGDEPTGKAVRRGG